VSIGTGVLLSHLAIRVGIGGDSCVVLTGTENKMSTTLRFGSGTTPHANLHILEQGKREQCFDDVYYLNSFEILKFLEDHNIPNSQCTGCMGNILVLSLPNTETTVQVRYLVLRPDTRRPICI
jgi:hypothetical protein